MSKRKTTQIEEKLIEDGWYLKSKSYSGKNSEKTDFYDYTKNVEFEENFAFAAIVRLDSKREKVINIGIPNINVDNLTRDKLDDIHLRFEYLQTYIQKLLSAQKQNDDPQHTLTLDDLELSPKQKQIVIHVAGTNELEKLKSMPSLLVKLLCATNDLKLISVLTRAGVIQCQEQN